MPLGRALADDRRNGQVTCLICGHQATNLTQHLYRSHGKSSDEYRRALGLPDTHPVRAKDLD